jgi:hypothetical protein
MPGNGIRAKIKAVPRRVEPKFGFGVGGVARLGSGM